MELEKQIIEAGYKALAKKYHPDAGGSEEGFKNLQAARENLIDLMDWASAMKAHDGKIPPIPEANPPSSSPPIVPGSRHTVDDVFDLAGRIVDIFNPKPKRKPRKRADGQVDR